MSSYLSFFIVPKRENEEEEKKHIIIASYSRSTEIYQYFDENLHPVWTGNENKYTVLDSEKIGYVLHEFDYDISKLKTKLNEYEKHVKDNPDYINDIISMKEYIENLEYWRNKTSFIEDMLSDMSCYDEIEEICCHIS